MKSNFKDIAVFESELDDPKNLEESTTEELLGLRPLQTYSYSSVETYAVLRELGRLCDAHTQTINPTVLHSWIKMFEEQCIAPKEAVRRIRQACNNECYGRLTFPFIMKDRKDESYTDFYKHEPYDEKAMGQYLESIIEKPKGNS